MAHRTTLRILEREVDQHLYCVISLFRFPLVLPTTNTLEVLAADFGDEVSVRRGVKGCQAHRHDFIPGSYTLASIPVVLSSCGVVVSDWPRVRAKIWQEACPMQEPSGPSGVVAAPEDVASDGDGDEEGDKEEEAFTDQDTIHNLRWKLKNMTKKYEYNKKQLAH